MLPTRPAGPVHRRSPAGSSGLACRGTSRPGATMALTAAPQTVTAKAMYRYPTSLGSSQASTPR